MTDMRANARLADLIPRRKTMEATATSRRIESGPGRVTAGATRVPWRDVAVFAALAYAISWVLWIPEMPDAWHAITTGNTPNVYAAGGLSVLGMFGPGIAAVIMRLFISNEGLRGSLGPVRRKGRYFALAAVGPALFVLATVGIAVATGLSEFTLGSEKPLWYVALVLLAVGTPMAAVLAFGEEYGWRGYLLPKLLSLGEVKASLIIALIWAPWHIPVLFAGLNYGGENTAAVLAFMIVTGIGLSLLFTRMFVAAGGSVLVVAVMHGSLNAFSDRLADTKHLLGDPLVVSIGGAIGFAMMAVALVAVYGPRRRRSALSRHGKLEENTGGANSTSVASRGVGVPSPTLAGAVNRASSPAKADYKDTGLHEYKRGLFPPR
jgi:uncharacterized protein